MIALATFLFATAPAAMPADCTIACTQRPPCYIGDPTGPYVGVPCSVYDPVVAPIVNLYNDVRTIIRNLPIKY
jgi:hypothetical protein